MQLTNRYRKPLVVASRTTVSSTDASATIAGNNRFINLSPPIDAIISADDKISAINNRHSSSVFVFFVISIHLFIHRKKISTKYAYVYMNECLY